MKSHKSVCLFLAGPLVQQALEKKDWEFFYSRGWDYKKITFTAKQKLKEEFTKQDQFDVMFASDPGLKLRLIEYAA